MNNDPDYRAVLNELREIKSTVLTIKQGLSISMILIGIVAAGYFAERLFL